MNILNSTVLKNYKSDLKELIINTIIGLTVSLLIYTLFAIYFADNFNYIIFSLIVILFGLVRFWNYKKSYYPYSIILQSKTVDTIDLVLKRKKSVEISKIKYLIIDSFDKIHRIEFDDYSYTLVEAKFSEISDWINSNNIKIGKIEMCYQYDFEFVQYLYEEKELIETDKREIVGYVPNRKFY